MIEVFLGGTCNGSDWRDTLISMLKVMFFNPVVEDWTEEAQLKEIEKRKTCDLILYTITPKMSGVYSIAELVDDSNKKPDKTMFCFLEYDDDYVFNDNQTKSLQQVKKLVEENGAKTFDSLIDVANYINNYETHN